MNKGGRIGRAGQESIGSRKELVDVRGRVPRAFFNWFDEQSGNTRKEKEMLRRWMLLRGCRGDTTNGSGYLTAETKEVT